MVYLVPVLLSLCLGNSAPKLACGLGVPELVPAEDEGPAGDPQEGEGSRWGSLQRLRVILVMPTKQEHHSGDPVEGRRVVVVILAEEEGCLGDPHGERQLFWGSLQKRTVVLGIFVEKGSCSGDPCKGQLFWGSSWSRRVVVMLLLRVSTSAPSTRVTCLTALITLPWLNGGCRVAQGRGSRAVKCPHCDTGCVPRCPSRDVSVLGSRRHGRSRALGLPAGHRCQCTLLRSDVTGIGP